MSFAPALRKTPLRSRTLKAWVPRMLWFLCLLTAVWLVRASFPASKPADSNRRCVAPWPTAKKTNGLQMCITTLSDSKVDSKFTKAARRNFTDVLDATWTNKLNYATKHKYSLFNASDLVDVQRPPSWSKILAVQDALSSDCDWVFWMDPDSLVMNSQIRLEEIIPSNENANLVITRDATGYNAGMWIIRKSTWATEFLKEWWSMTSFIRSPGDTKSGDNDALKAYLGQMDSLEEHVYVAPQCVFNSYLWTPGLKSWRRYLWDRTTITNGLYTDGDFVLHLAGVDAKTDFITKFGKDSI